MGGVGQIITPPWTFVSSMETHGLYQSILRGPARWGDMLRIVEVFESLECPGRWKVSWITVQ